jgi:dihydroorotate dehydrogenase
LLYKIVRKLIYKFEPETTHFLGEKFLQFVNLTPVCSLIWKTNYTFSHIRLEQNILGIEFKNPVGLGAGFDKNGTMINEMNSLGFGFTEIGTITPKPQDGNPQPRLYRHIKEETIQNAMGFNNDGSEKILERVEKLYPFIFPVGINIGKNKTTSEENSISDYLTLIDKFEKFASYLVINISSPNTPNLRDLQNESFISELFTKAKEKTSKPIFLKIAPDMSEENAVNLSKLAVEKGASGIGGGLSGKVLTEKSFKIFEAIAKELYGKTILISVGGINSPEEAYRRLKAGASLIQIYSALIFQGPSLIKNINKGLMRLMKRDGFGHISEVIGLDRK